MNEQEFIDKARQLLKKAGIDCGESAPKTVAPDGSNRKFWRFPGAIAVAPEKRDDVGMAEATATWQIGRNLFRQGCAIPEVYGFDEESGILVMEDLGNRSLYERVQQLKKEGDVKSWDEIHSLYEQVLDALVQLQILGVEGLQTEWCWESPQYNSTLMLEKESGYFLSAWWQTLQGRDVPQGIMEEFTLLARRAENAAAGFFLHRDCQSRNIFLVGDKPKFIDFQGGRKGPLAYDLASLLMDPYVGLPQELQEQLFRHYFEALAENGVKFAEEEFRFWYEDIALHRNLQIIGAFSFLSHVQGKVFFAQFVEPSVTMLRRRLAAPQFSQFVVLRKMAERDLNL